MRIFKVPDGSSPNPDSGEPGPAVVICRGDSYNLWIDHTDTVSGPEQLNEADAMVFGLSARPGTPDDQYIGVIESEMNTRFGTDISAASVDEGAYGGDPPVPATVKQLLQNQDSLAPSDENFQKPWDVEQWNSPAGEPPKRKPTHEKEQEENRQ